MMRHSVVYALVVGLLLNGSQSVAFGFPSADNKKVETRKELVTRLNQLAEEIEDLQEAWVNERAAGKRHELWRTLTQKIKLYNRLLENYQKLTQAPSTNENEQQTATIPSEAKELLQRIHQLEDQIFRLQKELNTLFQKYQTLPKDTPEAKRKALKRMILRWRARKDALLKQRTDLIRTFERKFSHLKSNQNQDNRSNE